MKKILIIGSEGMAGHLLVNYLNEQSDYEIFTISRSEHEDNENHLNLDVSNTGKLVEFIEKICPNYIINCVGILVQDSIANPDKAAFINAYLPHFLDKLSKKYNYKLIHISTDCVFDGKTGNYTESDIPNETNFYGRSKALGEIINDRNLTIRTSIVGPEIKKDGIGLFHWFMSQTGDINGYSRAIWSGVTTFELAKFIKYLLSEDINLTGLYHLCNNDKITKENLLLLFQEYFARDDINIQTEDKLLSDKSFFNTQSSVQYETPSFKQMIYEMKNWVLEHQESLYQQYKIKNNILEK